MNEFIITIDEKKSEEIEKTKYELDRECQNIARRISKDLPFDSIAVKNNFDILAEKVAYYDMLKDKLSDEVVIPRAIEKWGNTAAVAWTLDFHTHNITVVLTNRNTNTTYDSVVDVDEQLSSRMKYLSINTKVCEEIDDMIAATYPTIDTSSYKEFLAFKKSLDDEYDEKKRFVEANYAQPWVAENLNGYVGKFDWTLVFNTNKITISAE